MLFKSKILYFVACPYFTNFTFQGCHIAYAPLTITSSRIEVVDFTVPFATTALAILYKKPPRGQLLPFTNLGELVESDVEIGTGMVSHGDTLFCLKTSRNPLLRKLYEKVSDNLPPLFT